MVGALCVSLHSRLDALSCAPLADTTAAQDEYIPWGTLRYLIGEAMYGGRVSDSLDRRILTTYLDEYLGDFLFDTFQPFKFFASKDVDISVPPTGPREVYLKAVEALPLVQSPEVCTNSCRHTCRHVASRGVLAVTTSSSSVLSNPSTGQPV